MAGTARYASDDLTLYLPRGSLRCSALSAVQKQRQGARSDAERSEGRPPAAPALTRSWRRWLVIGGVAGLATLMLARLPFRAGSSVDDAPVSCPPQKLGTRVDFVSSPADALRLSGRGGKLAFILHISGHFEQTEFT